jgi:hypothetical protein
MQDSDALLGRLIEHRVDFVVVGGYAAVAHGVTILTQDLDICCAFDPDNLERLAKALSGLHPVLRMRPDRMPFVFSPETCRGLRNLYLDTDLGQLDCLGEVTGVGDFAAVRAASLELAIAEGVCRILSLDTLIRAKEAMDRPRDREAALQLRAIRERRSRG